MVNKKRGRRKKRVCAFCAEKKQGSVCGLRKALPAGGKKTAAAGNRESSEKLAGKGM